MMHYSRICAALGLLDDPQLEHLEVLEEQVVSLIDEKKLVDAANVSYLVNIHNYWKKLKALVSTKCPIEASYLQVSGALYLWESNSEPTGRVHSGYSGFGMKIGHHET